MSTSIKHNRTRPAFQRNPQRGKSTASVLMAAAGLALVSGAIIWGFYADAPAPEAPTAREAAPPPARPAPEPEPPAALDPVPAAPIVETPSEPPEEIATESSEPPAPVVTLAESDPLVREAILELDAGPVFEQFASAEHLIERGVSLLDNLAAGAVPYRLIPIARPKKAFPIRDNGLRVTADPAGYARFDGLSEWVSSLDTPQVVALFRRFEPAANEAFAMLGYEEGDIESRMRRALRLVLTTPEIPADAELVRDEAVWAYADPELEGLPDLQKQLLRMGPANLERIQNMARELSYALDDTADSE